LGGAGAVIIGGLYWKKGTTLAAYISMITGSTMALAGIVIRQLNHDFFLNGMQISFITAIAACTVYVIVSLLTYKKEDVNLDKILNRGEYSIADDVVVGDTHVPSRSKWRTVWTKFGLTDEFSKGDKFIFFCVYGFTGFWYLVFILITAYHLIFGTDSTFWIKYWWIYLLYSLPLSTVLTIWMAAGGVIDTKRMLQRLKTIKRDVYDDGWEGEEAKEASDIKEPDKAVSSEKTAADS
jgi:SSS family solute:Na+ symporter